LEYGGCNAANIFFNVVFYGMATATFAQTTSSDSQTLQALLAEVRQLRQDLQVSLTRIQSAQILLSRQQIQQVAVSRASQHLNDARSKLAEVQVVIRSEAAEIKHYEGPKQWRPRSAGRRCA